MTLSRSPSFRDDDLEFISSQTANMSLAHLEPSETPKRPLQPIRNPNAEVTDLTDSPIGKAATAMPTFGLPTQMQSPLVKRPQPCPPVRKEASCFIPKSHHRDLFKTSGPLMPKSSPRKQGPLQMFSAIDGAQAAPQYSQSAALFNDQTFYTDPAKASADLKALLEGGMDEEEEGEGAQDKEEKVEDGTVDGIEVKLLPHQVEGVEWMRGREVGPIKGGKVPKGGILADDMGLGKTLQSISLIVTQRKPEPDDKRWKKHFEYVRRATLVVAPLALIRQWEAEIKDKVSKDLKLKVYVHHGPQRTKEPKMLGLYDVVITTYQILVSEFGQSSDDITGHHAGCFGVHWWRVILDEAHSIKNRNAKATKAACSLRAEYRWCLTGTPMQNNLDELQSLVHFLRIQPYDDLAEWRSQIDGPLKNGRGHVAIRRLHTLLRCFMKRRTKDILKEEGALVAGGKKALEAAQAKAKREGREGDEVDVPTPAFKVTERKVVTVAAEFSPAEQEFYNTLEARADASIEKMMQAGKSVSYSHALVLLLRLRQACNHPRLAETNFDKDKEALAAESSAQPRQQAKSIAADDGMDALADALGGMGIQTKRCDMCLGELSRDEVADGHVRCSECTASLDKLNAESPERRKSKKKSKRVSVVAEELKIEEKKKPRNRARRVIVDSDDEDEEEAEGSWLVGEDQQGSLRLGKAGGTDDEDAEGGGDDIGSDDSDHPSENEDDGSQLDSFIVKDDEVKQDDGDDDSGSDESDESDSDASDTFVSVDKIRARVIALQKGEAAPSDSDSSEDESEQGISESELDSDSDSDGPPQRLPKGKPARTKDGHQVMMSAKMRELISILRKEVSQHKFIVFSQFTSMLDLIEPFFRAQAGFKFARYDGRMGNDARETALHALRHDSHTRILLCSLKCGALGLNLTAATRVVLVEPFWNPFVEEQAIDRVHRLTQKTDVVVYKLTVAGTVEERILELQSKKRLLAEAAIEGGMRKRGKDQLKLGLNEILDLFKRDASGPGHADQDADYVGAGAMARDMRGTVKGKKKVGRPEVDDAYGRRW